MVARRKSGRAAGAGGGSAGRALVVWGLGIGALLAAGGPVFAAPPGGVPPRVVASIRPLHSLVAGVMQGVGEPVLLLRGRESPHHHSLRPSQARALARAAVVFWVGPGLETFMERPLRGLSGQARIVALARAAGVGLRAAGRGGEKPPSEIEQDPHLWLDPRNAAAMAGAAAQALAAADPPNAGRYTENARTLAAALARLEAGLREKLAPLRGRPFLVYHDAYGYFEDRFGLKNLGAVTLTPEQPPGVRRVAEVRGILRGAPGACLFAEPGTSERLTENLLRGTGARRGILDPLGVALAPGPGLYFQMMEGLGKTLAGCLGG